MSLEDLTLIKIRDAVRQCEQKSAPKFVGFLSETELGTAVNFLNNEKVKYCVFGGYSESSRGYVCIMPEWLERENVTFPISTVEFINNSPRQLSHRDYLGAVMALGITKNSIGDILVGDRKTYMFTADSVSEFIVSQITKVGNAGVTASISNLTEFFFTKKTENFTSTVASMRLDCVVSALCNCVRKKACELIESGLVVVNSATVEKVAFTVKPNSKISVRKFGKFVIESCADYTKKQRIVLKYKKYL